MTFSSPLVTMSLASSFLVRSSKYFQYMFISEMVFHGIFSPFFFCLCLTSSSLCTSCRGCVASFYLWSRLRNRRIVFDCGDCIFSYPVDDEFLCSGVSAVESFKGSEFPLPLHCVYRSYRCYCIGCSGIAGIYVDGWILHPRVFYDDGTVLLHVYYYGKVSMLGPSLWKLLSESFQTNLQVFLLCLIP